MVLAGARSVHEAGGTVLAQDAATSAVWGMPGRVSQTGIVECAAAADVAGRRVDATGMGGTQEARRG